MCLITIVCFGSSVLRRCMKHFVIEHMNFNVAVKSKWKAREKWPPTSSPIEGHHPPSGWMICKLGNNHNIIKCDRNKTSTTCNVTSFYTQFEKGFNLVFEIDSNAAAIIQQRQHMSQAIPRHAPLSNPLLQHHHSSSHGSLQQSTSSPQSIRRDQEQHAIQHSRLPVLSEMGTSSMDEEASPLIPPPRWVYKKV